MVKVSTDTGVGGVSFICFAPLKSGINGRFPSSHRFWAILRNGNKTTRKAFIPAGRVLLVNCCKKMVVLYEAV
jgi:hypothetical protein